MWRLQEGSREREGGGRQKKNTLQEDYAPSMPSLLQEFVMLHLVCKCGGRERERELLCVCVCFFFVCGLPEFMPSLQAISGKFIMVGLIVVPNALHSLAHRH